MFGFGSKPTQEKQEYVISDAKRALLKPDEDGSYMGLIDAGDEEQVDLEKFFDAVAATGDRMTKADLLHPDKFGEPALTFEEMLKHFPWIMARLKTTTGETFTVEELGDIEYGDDSDDHPKATILESAGEENLLGQIFAPKNWVGRADDCAALHGKIPDEYKEHVDLDEVLAQIRLASLPLLTDDTTLTKKKLYARDKEGFSAFDNPLNREGLLKINALLVANNQGSITFDELASCNVKNGDTALFHLVETLGIDPLIQLSVATGDALKKRHLKGLPSQGINKDTNVLGAIIQQGELDKLFPVPGDAPETRLWVNRPKEMLELWNQVQSDNKHQVADPDFNTRLNMVNGLSLASARKSTGVMEL